MLATKKPMLTCPMERQPMPACVVFMKTRYKSTKLLQQAGVKLSTAYCQILGEEEGSGGEKIRKRDGNEKWGEFRTFKTRISFLSNRLRRRISSGVSPASSSSTSSKMSASFIGKAIFSPAVPLLRCNSTTRELKIKTMIQTPANRFSKKHARTKENRKKDGVEERGTATRRIF